MRTRGPRVPALGRHCPVALVGMKCPWTGSLSLRRSSYISHPKLTLMATGRHTSTSYSFEAMEFLISCPDTKSFHWILLLPLLFYEVQALVSAIQQPLPVTSPLWSPILSPSHLHSGQPSCLLAHTWHKQLQLSLSEQF